MLSSPSMPFHTGVAERTAPSFKAKNIRAWPSLVGHLVWDQGAAGSNPVARTIFKSSQPQRLRAFFFVYQRFAVLYCVNHSRVKCAIHVKNCTRNCTRHFEGNIRPTFISTTNTKPSPKAATKQPRGRFPNNKRLFLFQSNSIMILGNYNVEVFEMDSLGFLLICALYILAVVFFVYGILAFRKYLKSDHLPPKNEKPEEG